MECVKLGIVLCMATVAVASAEVTPVIGMGWGGPKGIAHLGVAVNDFTFVGTLDEYIFGGDRYTVVAPAIAGGWKAPFHGVELWTTLSIQHVDVEGNGVSLARDIHVGSGPYMKNGWNAGLASISFAKRFGQSFGISPSVGYGVFLEDFSAGMFRIGLDFDWRGMHL